jgi:hypothetical protein
MVGLVRRIWIENAWNTSKKEKPGALSATTSPKSRYAESPSASLEITMYE